MVQVTLTHPASEDLLRIAVIGTGFGGLAATIELKKRGHDDIVVFEKAGDVGGVWRENTYPGAACDVPSSLYSYSFEPNPHWPHKFSRQPAILDYIHRVVDKYDVRRHIRFHTEVTAARWDDETQTWRLDLSTGETETVDLFVPAVGQLSRPSIPSIPGADTFRGEAFHSAEWNHDLSLTGKRVAVIGTGASAIQFVPEVRKDAAKVVLFQRTAPYIVPRKDFERTDPARPVPQLLDRAKIWTQAEWLTTTFHIKPLSAVMRTWSKRHMKAQTAAKPGLFEKVWPDYPFGCKRVLFADDYLPALAQPNVDVITDDITEITECGVTTADGRHHEVDVIIWGTGFKATDFLAPMTITGTQGRDLHTHWKDGAHAYHGMTVPGFPNLLIMYGPNTNTGGGSIIYFLETQARYLGRYADHIDEAGPLEVRAEVEEAYDARIQDQLADSVWSKCSSWYREKNGRITTNWPSISARYRRSASYRKADYTPA
jgi:cation diffusion facilitator CzcD-associated flavoprotein CzcO